MLLITKPVSSSLYPSASVQGKYARTQGHLLYLVLYLEVNVNSLLRFYACFSVIVIVDTAYDLPSHCLSRINREFPPEYSKNSSDTAVQAVKYNNLRGNVYM